MKDKENLFNHNIWSCGDYIPNTSEFYLINVKNTITLNTSYNGEKSILIQPLNTLSELVCEIRSNKQYGETGKTITFKCYIKTNDEIRLKIYQLINGSYYSVSSLIPAKSNGLFSISNNIDSNATKIHYRIEKSEPKESLAIYTDNWNLLIS